MMLLVGEHVILPHEADRLRWRIPQRVQVDAQSGCHAWSAAVCRRTGYAFISIGDRVRLRAHRVAYAVFVGDIAPGLEIDHLCRNRRCVNPAHLEPVTPAENRRRQGAATTHCPSGHEYTPENTSNASSRRPSRTCRTCKRERMAAARRLGRLAGERVATFKPTEVAT